MINKVAIRESAESRIYGALANAQDVSWFDEISLGDVAECLPSGLSEYHIYTPDDFIEMDELWLTTAREIANREGFIIYRREDEYLLKKIG